MGKSPKKISVMAPGNQIRQALMAQGVESEVDADYVVLDRHNKGYLLDDDENNYLRPAIESYQPSLQQCPLDQYGGSNFAPVLLIGSQMSSDMNMKIVVKNNEVHVKMNDNSGFDDCLKHQAQIVDELKKTSEENAAFLRPAKKTSDKVKVRRDREKKETRIKWEDEEMTFSLPRCIVNLTSDEVILAFSKPACRPSLNSEFTLAYVKENEKFFTERDRPLEAEVSRIPAGFSPCVHDGLALDLEEETEKGQVETETDPVVRKTPSVKEKTSKNSKVENNKTLKNVKKSEKEKTSKKVGKVENEKALKKVEVEKALKRAEKEKALRKVEEEKALRKVEEEKAVKKAEKEKALRKVEEEKALKKAEKEKALKKAMKEKALKLAEEEKALLKKAEKEKALKKAEEEKALLRKAEQEKALKKAEEEKALKNKREVEIEKAVKNRQEMEKEKALRNRKNVEKETALKNRMPESDKTLENLMAKILNHASVPRKHKGNETGAPDFKIPKLTPSPEETPTIESHRIDTMNRLEVKAPDTTKSKNHFQVENDISTLTENCSISNRESDKAAHSDQQLFESEKITLNYLNDYEPMDITPDLHDLITNSHDDNDNEPTSMTAESDDLRRNSNDNDHESTDKKADSHDLRRNSLDDDDDEFELFADGQAEDLLSGLDESIPTTRYRKLW